MHPDNKTFVIELSENPSRTEMDLFQAFLDKNAQAQCEYEEKIAKELNVSIECACDIAYLRTRSRWTQEKENKLIQSHKEGKPLNVLDGEI